MGAALALVGAFAFSALSATTAHAERVGEWFCYGVIIPGAYEDCVGASKYVVRDIADGSEPVCVGAFYPNETRLYGEYNCGGLVAEHNYSGEHLRPVIHNHGSTYNEVIGWVEYLT